MSKDLGILQTFSAMARHAQERQNVLAENIANADTPGYKAKDVTPFSEIMASMKPGSNGLTQSVLEKNTYEIRAGASPNGNTVSIEEQVFQQAAVLGQHEMATTIYKKTLDLLRMTVGRNA